jgi:hypothetical protein
VAGTIHPHRSPVIGAGPRVRHIEIMLNAAEAEALDELVKRRRCQSRADYFRVLMEADWASDLLIIDDAFGKIFEAVGKGFGGAAAQLTADADAWRLR